MGRSWRTPIKVRWGEADPMGIVFYPRYFTWFDHATHELFASSGRTLLTLLREEGVSVPIVECGAKMRAPVFADDELVVTSTAAEVGTRFIRIEHVVERGQEQVASGFEVRVVARVADGGRLEASRVPDALREWLAGEEPAAQ
jgi:YbgC/YbaW family acyl-CoA thioester hydrolase